MISAHSLQELHLQGAWLTVGVFDGVHRGHQQIIHRLVAGAHAAGTQAAVLTFWPHPATVLGNPDFKCLTTPDERFQLFSAVWAWTLPSSRLLMLPSPIQRPRILLPD